MEEKPNKLRLIARVAAAVGGFVGRIQASSAATREELGFSTPSGRLDHTWTSRNSSMNPAYDAAAWNRSTQDWRLGLTTSTLAIIEGLDVMLARSRHAIRNDGYAASIQGGYRRKVVGGGITARASARDPATGQMLKEYNAAHDLLWKAWANDPLLCDVEQTKSLYEQQSLWMDELVAAGGSILRPVYTPRKDGVGLAIQTLEYEQLRVALTCYGTNAVYHGIETDAYGAPVAYHVWAAEHPLEETPSKPVRLLASECWHLYRKDRVRQRLGAPMIAPVLPALRNLAMYELYMISRARTEAAYHGFVEEPAGSASSTDQIRARISGHLPQGQTEEGPDLQVRVENGLFPVLRGGRKVTFPTPNNPNSSYPSFVTENLKRICAGTGLDLPTVTRWYAEGNFNTQRKAALELEAETEAIQDQQFINGALRHVRALWTEIAVREGKLIAPKFFTSAAWRAAYLNTNWQGPPQRSVDVIKDQAAWDMKYRSLRGTPQQYCNEQGLDVRDLLSEWHEFRELVEEYDLEDMLDQFFFSITKNAPKAGMRPDGTGPGGVPPDAQDRGGVNQPDPAGGMSRRIGDQAVLETIFESIRGGDVSGGSGGNGHGSGGNGRH